MAGKSVHWSFRLLNSLFRAEKFRLRKTATSHMRKSLAEILNP
jgi:hypothetical protein